MMWLVSPSHDPAWDKQKLGNVKVNPFRCAALQEAINNFPRCGWKTGEGKLVSGKAPWEWSPANFFSPLKKKTVGKQKLWKNRWESHHPSPRRPTLNPSPSRERVRKIDSANCAAPGWREKVLFEAIKERSKWFDLIFIFLESRARENPFRGWKTCGWDVKKIQKQGSAEKRKWKLKV